MVWTLFVAGTVVYFCSLVKWSLVECQLKVIIYRTLLNCILCSFWKSHEHGSSLAVAETNADIHSTPWKLKLTYTSRGQPLVTYVETVGLREKVCLCTQLTCSIERTTSTMAESVGLGCTRTLREHSLVKNILLFVPPIAAVLWSAQSSRLYSACHHWLPCTVYWFYTKDQCCR